MMFAGESPLSTRQSSLLRHSVALCNLYPEKNSCMIQPLHGCPVAVGYAHTPMLTAPHARRRHGAHMGNLPHLGRALGALCVLGTRRRA